MIDLKIICGTYDLILDSRIFGNKKKKKLMNVYYIYYNIGITFYKLQKKLLIDQNKSLCGTYLIM